MKSIYCSLIVIIIFLMAAPESGAQKLFHSTRMKMEYQYSDYNEYTYPDPIYFHYPYNQYTQQKPYIADFPEHRFMYRIIQKFDYRTALTLRYHFSDLDVDSKQKSYYAKLCRELTDNLSVTAGSQYTDLEGQLSGWMYEAGLNYNYAGFFMIEPVISYYSNDDRTPGSDKSDAYSASLLIRQALNEVTALQVKYSRFSSEGSGSSFSSNTVTGWLSRYFYTETALHLSFRYHWNSFDLKAYSPEVELVQYLNWASVIRFMYRYYSCGTSDQKGDDLIDSTSVWSNAASVVLDYALFTKLTLSAKYRYYWSDRDIKMNTYLIGLEWLLD